MQNMPPLSLHKYLLPSKPYTNHTLAHSSKPSDISGKKKTCLEDVLPKVNAENCCSNFKHEEKVFSNLQNAMAFPRAPYIIGGRLWMPTHILVL